MTVKIYNKINITAVSKALNTFETEYVSSATSDANGKISFEKPNGPFLIEFDLSTLPSGMGLKKRNISYNQASVQSDTVKINYKEIL